jgi:hypothetical protein
MEVATMAKLPDGTFYRVVGVVGPTLAYPLYQGASLRTAEKVFGTMVYYNTTPAAKVAFKKPYSGVVGVPRVEIRYFKADGVSYQIHTTWRKDSNCDLIFSLLAKVNKPKFEMQLYGEHTSISPRTEKEAEEAADALAPLITQYNLHICYDAQEWTHWHGHNCHCIFTKQ